MANRTSKSGNVSDARKAPKGNRLLGLVALALAAGGVAEFSSASDSGGPPRPTANVIGKLPPASPSVSATTQAAVLPMARSVPTHISIPAVNLSADVISVDVNADGTVGTPTLANAKVAGWYDRSSTPGELGPAVLDAHVDSALMSDYRGAFFYLGLAKPGMKVDVTRADHSVAEFTIDEVQVALKSDFPSDKVYGSTSYPALRLITCGGNYDKKTHEYLGNTIVYAHLTSEKAGRKALGN